MLLKRPGVMLLAVVLSALLSGGLAAAEDLEYRSFQLSDGREMVGVVIETGAEGMTVRVPQGIATVPYGLLADIGVTNAAAVEAQGPLVIAVAPTQASDLDARAVAARIDGWLADAVAIVPQTSVLSAAAWEEALGGAGFELLGCAARVDCLSAKASKVSAKRILLPTLTLVDGVATLSLTGLVPSTQATIAAGSAIAGAGPEEHAAGVVAAAFQALALVPEIDTDSAATQRFAPPMAEIAPDSPPPAPPADAPPPANPADIPAAGPDPVDTELLRTVALGFAPVPGLNGAVNKDLPAFVSSLVGGVGSSWATVFAIGTKARTPQSFAGPALGASYALVVGWNQVTGLIGLAVRRGTETSGSSSLTPPLPALAIAPLVTNGRRGAAVTLYGRF